MSKTPYFIEICQKASEKTTNRLRLKEDKFLAMKIPLPPLEEQRRIVGKIEALAEKIEEVRSLRLQTIKETEALLNSEIYQIFTERKQKNWYKGKLADFVESDCYGTSEKTHPEILGTPILRMGNIQNGRLDISDLKYLHVQEKDRDKLILKKGDILVNRTNSAELVGKCAVFTLDGDYGFASYIITVRLDINKADPFLVAQYINSPLGRAYMFNERKQMTGQANVNAKKLKALPICLPSLPEQKRIVEYLDRLQSKIDEMKKEREKALEEMDALLPSILDKAFKGKLYFNIL